jgi:hypothetical protein
MTDDTAPMGRAEVHALLRRSFAMRAEAYAHMYDVLSERLGEPAALEACMEATRRLGDDMGAAFAHLGPADLAGLKDAFLGGIIEGPALFAPEVRRCDEHELQIYFHRCPLKEAWIARGRSDADVAALCKMAGAIDRGLFERAGFTFAGSTWQSGESGCCTLRVRPGPAKGPG